MFAVVFVFVVSTIVVVVVVVVVSSCSHNILIVPYVQMQLLAIQLSWKTMTSSTRCQQISDLVTRITLW